MNGTKEYMVFKIIEQPISLTMETRLNQKALGVGRRRSLSFLGIAPV
jgi:hypothetical protein